MVHTVPLARCVHYLALVPLVLCRAGCDIGRYVFGGFNCDGHEPCSQYQADRSDSIDDLWRFDTSNDSWTKVGSGLGQANWPQARCAATLVGLRNSLYLFGGNTRRSQDVFLRDLWQYDSLSLQWSVIAALDPPAPRSFHAAFALNDQQMLVLGGFGTSAQPINYSYVYIWSLANPDQWVNITVRSADYRCGTKFVTWQSFVLVRNDDGLVSVYAVRCALSVAASVFLLHFLSLAMCISVKLPLPVSIEP